MKTDAEFMKQLRDKRRKEGSCTRCGREKKNGPCESCKTDSKNNYIPGNLTKEEKAFICFIKKKTKPSGKFGTELKSLMVSNFDAPMVLAKYAGVSTKTIDSWLYRNQIPRKDKALVVALKYGKNLEDLGL